MRASESQPCEENCGFLQQYQKTKEVGEYLKASAKAVVERIEKASPCWVGKEEDIKLHNLKTLLKKADPAVDWSSGKIPIAQLQVGVMLSKKKKKFWLDEKSNKYCYMLFAEDLAITWAENPKHWIWRPPEEKNGDMPDGVHVAELLNVCWLEVHGKLNITKLSPETLYEVVFVVMLTDPAYGWEVPVNTRLTLPDEIKNQHRENLTTKPRGEWMEIPVGEFMTPLEKDEKKDGKKNGKKDTKRDAKRDGKIEFSLYEYEGGDWKKGLVIKGALIRPKN